MEKKLEQKIYFYRVYGLYIESNYQIEEFIQVKKEENANKVLIRNNGVSKQIKESIAQGKNFGFSKEEVWFNISEIAIYQVSNGNTINFEIYSNADKDLIKVYLMCSCLGFIMIQRKRIAIHGGCIVSNNKAVIITGERGAGKSTLTTAMRIKGYKFLADDVSALSNYDNTIMVEWGFPYQKLCISAMNNFKYEQDKYISIMGDNEMKYMIPVYDNFIRERVQLGAIFQLTCEDIDHVRIEEIKGMKKLKSLISSIYRGEFLQYTMGISSDYLKKCISIAQDIKFYKITRPKYGFSVDNQVKLIEDKLNLWRECSE